MGEIATIIGELSDEIGLLLTDTTIAGEIAGEAKAITSVPRAFFAGKPPIVGDLKGIFAGGDPIVRFPVIEDAITVLEDSPAFAGAEFRATAKAIEKGSFGITADLETETIGQIRDLLAKNIDRGPDLNSFIDDVTDLLGDGGGGLSEARLNMVFRNSVGTALSDAEERALNRPLVADAFPYRKVRVTRDNRLRSTHRQLLTLGLNGTAVYNRLDPVWQEFRGPWDFGCRCGFSPISVPKAAQLGVKEAIDWMDRARAMADEQGGQVFEFMEAAKPATFEFVKHPPFSGNPDFRRRQVVQIGSIL